MLWVSPTIATWDSAPSANLNTDVDISVFPQQSMLKQVMVYFLIVVIEASEDILVVNPIDNPTSFSDRVHSQHGTSNINSFDSGSWSHDWANSWATWGIILYNYLLNLSSNFLSEDLEDWVWNQVRGISLVVVQFNNNSFVHLNLMVDLMLIWIIGMNWVSHICWNQIRFLHCLFEVVSLLIFAYQQFKNSSHRLGNDWRASALSRAWSALFVVE